jgi:hypothetical protein
MTFQGGDFGAEGRHEADQPTTGPIPRPWEEFAPPAYFQPGPSTPRNRPPSAPVAPWTPPTYPPLYPAQAAYGAPGYPGAPSYPGGPGYGGPSYPPHYAAPGFGGPPGYPGAYDPYNPYRDRSHETNGLAIASLITSIAGGLIGIPLSFALIGILFPIIGAVLGGVALNQIKQTHQQGRGLAIAGIAVGVVAAVLLVLLVVFAFVITNHASRTS